jgi:hypothetical protein
MDIAGLLQSPYTQAVLAFVGIISVPLSIYLYRRAVTRHELSYTGWTTPLFHAYHYHRDFGNDTYGDAEITFLKKSGPSLFRTIFWVGNTGNQPIRSSDLLGPLQIIVEGSPVFYAAPYGADPDVDCKFQVSPNSEVNVEFQVLRPGCGFCAELWHGSDRWRHPKTAPTIELRGKTAHIERPNLRAPFNIRLIARFLRVNWALAISGFYLTIQLLSSTALDVFYILIVILFAMIWAWRYIGHAVLELPRRFVWTRSKSSAAYWDGVSVPRRELGTWKWYPPEEE